MRLVFETLSRRALPPEKSAPLLANGLKDADRLQNLVESLLLAARLEDNWRPATEAVNFAEIARESAESLKVRFPNADIALDFMQGGVWAQADKLGLTAVVYNLLENALKYAPDGSPVHLKAAQKGGRLHFSVADQGRGIPDNEKQTVFEKFYRMGNEDTRETTGTGLGLYIVSQVVKAHRGKVRILDNKPQGAIFEVEI
jgi:K+-sensing histidine kinase KdpD